MALRLALLERQWALAPRTAGGNGMARIGRLAPVTGVLALTYFATRWIARCAAPRGVSPGTGGGGGLELLCLLSLGRDERLALVRLGERCLLLGVAAGRIELLCELTAEESAAWLAGQKDGPTTPPSFLEAVKRELSKRK